MNRERIEYCIELMRGATALDMTDYQLGGVKVKSVEELHVCGNTACFAGYVALSERFQADGGRVVLDMPILGGRSGPAALADWLGMSYGLAARFVLGYDDFYPVPFAQVKPHHVIEKLQAILDGELV